MKVLITGGAGFIGSHLTEPLLVAGATVRVLDNLSTGKRENLPAHPQFEFMLGDVRDQRLVLAAAGMNAIVHLAAVASVQASVDDPIGMYETNFDGICWRRRAKIIFAEFSTPAPRRCTVTTHACRCPKQKFRIRCRRTP